MKKLLQYSCVSTVGLGAFLGGIYYEKQFKGKLPFSSDNQISIFGSVLAATSFSPAPVQEVSVGNRISQIMKHGFPSLDNIRSFDDFVLSYDKRNRVANWVFEHLTAENVKYNKEVDRSKCDFKVDESIHPYFR